MLRTILTLFYMNNVLSFGFIDVSAGYLGGPAAYPRQYTAHKTGVQPRWDLGVLVAVKSESERMGALSGTE